MLSHIIIQGSNKRKVIEAIADFANSKRHQRLDKILIIFTRTIQEVSKVVYKKTMSETRAFISKLMLCMKRAHYIKCMLLKHAFALSFPGRIA